MEMNRRELLIACAGALPALATRPSRAAAPPDDRNPLGLVVHSFAYHIAAQRGEGRARFDDPMAFLDYCHGLGARGVQVALGVLDEAEARALNEKAAAAGMYIEAIVRTPRNQADERRFTEEIRTAQRAGAKIARTVMLGGRRYETFTSEAAFRRFADEAFAALSRAARLLESGGTGIRLAVENHKDFRAEELAAMLKRVGSKSLGVCLDTGNNIALLEDPLETVEALAPWSVTTHIKDMEVEEYEGGFLLAEVPLGEGFLDLPRIVRVLRAADPEIPLNLEMITRDPLKIPCLDPVYWATLGQVPGRDLARTLAMVRKHAARTPLPRTSQLGRSEQLAAEDRNIRRCLDYAREHLGRRAQPDGDAPSGPKGNGA